MAASGPEVATFAIMGSTGNTGTSVIELLLAKPNVKINAYCRNSAKLFEALPQTRDSKKLEVFEGSIQDADLLGRCMKGAKAVFLLASTNQNVPGCRISQDLSAVVITALKQLKAESDDFVAPKLLLLSSATVDDYLSRHIPFFRPIMLRAASNIYEDLRRTETFLRSQEHWLTTIYIKPGGLSKDIQRGHRLTLHEEETFLSYMDLAAGMIEAASETSDQWDFKNVGVVNTNGKARFERSTPATILFGLIRHYFPSMHKYLPS